MNPPPSSDEGKEEHRNKNQLNKINEESMTFSKKKGGNPRDFLKTAKEKEMFDKVVSIIPPCGDKIPANEVSFWITKWGVKRVEEAITFYWQRVEKALNNKKVYIPKCAGKYIRWALNEDKKPTSDDYYKNKAIAEDKCIEEPNNFSMTQEYLKIKIENIREEIYFSLPHVSFMEALRSY